MNVARITENLFLLAAKILIAAFFSILNLEPSRTNRHY